MTIENNLAVLYRERFKDNSSGKRQVLWQTLYHAFFRRYITSEMHVLDLGAGYCEFINAINCKSKYAVDLNPQFSQYANAGVKCFVSSVTDLSCIESQSMDLVFMSNLLEHLPTKNDVLEALRQVHQVLKANGRIMLLQPNIRFLCDRFDGVFDFFGIVNAARRGLDSQSCCGFLGRTQHGLKHWNFGHHDH